MAIGLAGNVIANKRTVVTQKRGVVKEPNSVGQQVECDTLTLSPIRIAKAMLYVALALLACHVLICHLGEAILGFLINSTHITLYEDVYHALYEKFHLGLEDNIPTYYSAFLLAVASLLLFMLHGLGNKKTNHWILLSVIFMFLSIDESVQLHETFGGIAGLKINARLTEVPTYLKWAWMVPYGIFTLAVGLYFLKFTLNLPTKTRNLFFIAGFIYVFAALGLEFFESHYDTVYGPDNLVNQVLFPLEEVLEMVGVILFIYAILDYMKRHKKVLQLSLSNRN